MEPEIPTEPEAKIPAAANPKTPGEEIVVGEKTEFVRIGDIMISSNSLDITQILNLISQALKDDDIKSYLYPLKSQRTKILGMAFG